MWAQVYNVPAVAEIFGIFIGVITYSITSVLLVKYVINCVKFYPTSNCYAVLHNPAVT